ncbi:MAG: hypothetical protein KF886_16640 [Candidatus Hydrogenedentes bacterium]|nr:hypothetical protein [Candidatus Hydrogenedentota bacterium]
MNVRLAKCARCNKLYNRILSEVCNACQPAEDADYARIRDALLRAPDMTAEQVALEADVSFDCVLRMLREGRIENIAHDSDAKCGRCGAPAISETKRLCRKCLMALDRECATAMHEMRARIMARDSTEMNDVIDAVEERRKSAKQRRKVIVPELPAPPQGGRLGNRMVIPDQLRKKREK